MNQSDVLMSTFSLTHHATMIMKMIRNFHIIMLLTAKYKIITCCFANSHDPIHVDIRGYYFILEERAQPQ